jgi:hypothetical protein
MSNIQYEKITGSIHNLRKGYKNRRDEVVKELVESIKEIELSVDSMKNENEQDYLYLGIIKLHMEKIHELQSKMEVLDDLKASQLLIEKNFPIEKLSTELGSSENKIYWYTYRHRGFSLGCQPKDFIRHDETVSKFGATAYRRPLTHEELVEYEMHLYKIEEGNNPAEWVTN